ncbi:MAG TPA: hypothetical protein VMR81_07440 [Patescibacteria group bacterium]|nr:hypothetical protein [Patescibacteria group bacterium]
MQQVRSGKKFYISQAFRFIADNPKNPKVQMNPRTAVMLSESRLRVQQLIGTALIIIIFIGYMVANALPKKPVSVGASFNFAHSLIGSVLSVDTIKNQFILSYWSSEDAEVINARELLWTVHLIPGGSISKSLAKDHVCYLMDNISTNLTAAAPADCNSVITKGRKLLMEYVFLHIPNDDMVVRVVIGER